LFVCLFVSVKVTVKFIRKRICFQQTENLSFEWEQWGGEREKHFLFPMQEMGAKTPCILLCPM
jgi:hypothetical protein